MFRTYYTLHGNIIPSHSIPHSHTPDEPSGVLLEPFYDRVFDIGTTFEVVRQTDGEMIRRMFMVENSISEAGGFAGGFGASTHDKFKSYIMQKYSYCLDELEKIVCDISDVYQAMGARGNIQIDSFVYRDRHSGECDTDPL
jgi:hypothetical protein